MQFFREIIEYSVAPALYRAYKTPNSSTKKYIEGPAESLGGTIVSILNAFPRDLILYGTPVFIVLLRSSEYTSSIIKIALSVITVYTTAFILRGYGRRSNPDYVSFYQKFQILKNSNWLENSSQVTQMKNDLMKYDFEFSYFPVQFKSQSPVVLKYSPPEPDESGIINFGVNKALDIISYLAVITFGRRLMYPGSVWIFQKAIEPMMQQGRTQMVERFGGERFKIETVDGNLIDTFLVDRRASSTSRGKKLVICCEGNAGFYEFGIMCTPLDAGYSTLGWNRPGFAGSTGLPYRSQEVAAIDAVVKFAISRGFEESKIILFGWSIGGFPSSIAAMQYPKVAGLVLDASFDDVIPLARSKMPSSWKPIVEHTVRSYFNLNVSENIAHYNGPVLIIRRLQDEIIHTLETDPVRTNRANDILIKLLSSRFPKLYDGDADFALREYLRGNFDLHSSLAMDENNVKITDVPDSRDQYYQSKLVEYVQTNGISSYPIDFDSPAERVQYILFLAKKHFKNYDSTHCTPLPSEYLTEPWDLFALSQSGLKSQL